MSWMYPAAKQGAKYAVKYGPQAKIAWDKGGKKAAAVAAAKAQARLERRKAFRKAATVLDGAVLQQVAQGQPVWVVLSGATPVDCYPACEVPLPELLASADLTNAVTSRDHEAAKLTNKLGRSKNKKTSAVEPLD